MLIVLFLPIITFTLFNLFRDSDIEQIAPPGLIKNLAWSASKIAEESETMDDEHLRLWVAEISGPSELEIYIRRDGVSFFSPDSEWLESYVQATQPHKPGQPVMSTVMSRSGRTETRVMMYPFGRRGIRAPKIPFHLLITVLLSLGFSFMLVRNLITPLAELRVITRKMQDGDLSVQVSSSMTERGDEFADLGRSFNKMAKHVENLLSSQKRLLSDISHEIRSPLQRIEVASALLRKESRNDAEKYIDRIELEIGRIDDMVEELLTLARLEEIPMMSHETVKLDEIIGSMVDDVSFASNIKQDNIHSNIKNLSVTGDAVLLSRAFGNVLYNAVRYAPPDKSIEIDARVEGERVAVVIRDHGVGVPEDELNKIFLPYYRTDKARARSQGGVGLGLAISKRIIESFGGDISASNAPGGGLAVTVRLPYRLCQPD
jgi:signal transduction histidine kinase